jgi:hypothetical protein
VEFVLMQAEHTPQLVLADIDVRDLGDGVFRVAATVRNDGEQPTELAIRREQNRATPVRVAIQPGSGVELLSADADADVGILSGHSQEEIEWLVRAPQGGTVTVTARHPKAGTVATNVALGGR